MAARFACLGLLSRKERWSLSSRGWVLLLSSVLCLSVLGFLAIHPFLALSSPVKSDVLVVEGWIPESAVKMAADEFNSKSYGHVYTVGGPVGGMPDDAAYDDTYAYVAAKKLEKAGVAPALIKIIPTRVKDRDRTYSSAIQLRKWLADNYLTPDSLNIATLGVHARRSRLLFEKAFGSGVQIGIIAVPHPDYRANRWWRYSEGVKEVFSEAAAYLYVRFFFWP